MHNLAKILIVLWLTVWKGKVQSEDGLEENVALNKKVYSTSLYYKKLDNTILTDGSTSYMDWVGSTAIHMIVDLGATYDITEIKFHGESWKIFKYLDFVALDDFVWCNIEDALKWPVCNGESSDGVFKAARGQCTGRYVGVRFKQVVNFKLWIKLSEIMMKGYKSAEQKTPSVDATKACQMVPKEKNLAMNKRAIRGQRTNILPRAMDGVTAVSDVHAGCYFADMYRALEIDLNGRFKLDKIRIWNTQDKNAYGVFSIVKVSIGVKQNTGLMKYTQLADRHVIGPTMDIKLEQPLEADSIYFYPYKNTTEWDRYFICELEVTGGSPMPEPEIKSEDIRPLDASDFPIAAEIRAGTTKVKIPAFSADVSFQNGCESIITFPNQLDKAFALACRYGKGRVMFFGKVFDIINSLKEWVGDVMADKMIKWMTNGAVSGVADVKYLTANDWQKASPSNVLVFRPHHVIPDQDAFLAKLKNAEINVMFEATMYAVSSRKNFQFLFDALHVDYYHHVHNYAIVSVELKDTDYRKFSIPISKMLSRMERSHTEFLELSEKVKEATNGLSPADVSQETVDSIRAIEKKYRAYVTRYCPSKDSPLRDQDKKATIAAYGRIVLSQLLAGSGAKAPCQAAFPGEVADTVPRQTATLNIKAVTTYELHSTGLYLAPGDTLQFEVISSETTTDSKWQLSLGCFRRTLYNRVQKVDDQILRFPETHLDSADFGVAMKKTTGSFYSGFGGVLYIKSKAMSGSKATLSIRIKGVVKIPFFNMRDEASKAKARWEESISSVDNFGPVAEFQGSYFSVCVLNTRVHKKPYSYFKTIFEKYWDPTVLSDIVMRHYNPDTYKMQRFTVDLQLPYGYGISGYPMAGNLEWEPYLVDLNHIQNTGSWGVFHELGHNFDSTAIDFTGSTDVTTNIFCLLNLHLFWGINPMSPKIRIAAKDNVHKVASIQNKYNSTVSEFSVWRSDHTFAFSIWGQIAEYFGIGVFQRFYGIDFTKVARHTQLELHDTWYEGLSNVTGFNLKPMFNFWQFTVSQEASDRQQSKPCFFPKDQLTNTAPKRYEAISKVFNNECLDKSNAKKFEFQYPAEKVVRPNDVDVQFEK